MSFVKLKKSSKWDMVRRKKGALARLASFDKAKSRVFETDNIEVLVNQLSSEIQPEREKAVIELVRAGILALSFLPRVCSLLTHELWTRRLTGVEALGSIALAEPTRDRLAQYYERLRIIEAEIAAVSQRYHRLNHKKARRKEERIELAAGLIAIGETPPPGVTAELYSDDEDQNNGFEVHSDAMAFGNHHQDDTHQHEEQEQHHETVVSPSAEGLHPVGEDGAEEESEINAEGNETSQKSENAAALSSTVEQSKLPPKVKPHKKHKKKRISEMERAQALFVQSQKRLATTARNSEMAFKHEMEGIKHSMLSLSLERMKTRDEIRKLDETVVAARRDAMGHGREVVYLLDDPRSPAALREAALRTITILDGINGGGRQKLTTLNPPKFSINESSSSRPNSSEKSARGKITSASSGDEMSGNENSKDGDSNAMSLSIPMAPMLGVAAGLNASKSFSIEPSPSKLKTNSNTQSNLPKKGINNNGNKVNNFEEDQEEEEERGIDLEVLAAVRRRIVDEDWKVRKLAIEALEKALGPSEPDEGQDDEAQEKQTLASFKNNSLVSHNHHQQSSLKLYSPPQKGGGNSSIGSKSVSSMNSSSNGHSNGGGDGAGVDIEGDGGWRLHALRKIVLLEQVPDVIEVAIRYLAEAKRSVSTIQAPLLPRIALLLTNSNAGLRGAAAFYIGRVGLLQYQKWEKQAKEWDLEHARRLRTTRTRRAKKIPGMFNDLDDDELPRPHEPHMAPYILALVRALKDGEESVREVAIRAIGELRGNLAASIAAPMLCRGVVNATALRRVCHDTSDKINQRRSRKNRLKGIAKFKQVGKSVRASIRVSLKLEAKGIDINSGSGGSENEGFLTNQSGKRGSLSADLLSKTHKKMLAHASNVFMSEDMIVRQVSQEHEAEHHQRVMDRLKSQEIEQDDFDEHDHEGKYDHLEYIHEERDDENDVDVGADEENELIREMKEDNATLESLKQQEENAEGQEEDEEIEYLNMGPALVCDRRGEVRAAACRAIGMLGAGSLISGERRGGSGEKAPDQWAFDYDRHMLVMNGARDLKMAKAKSLRAKARRLAVQAGRKGDTKADSKDIVDIAEQHAQAAEFEAHLAEEKSQAPYESPSEVALLKAVPNIGNLLFEIARMDADEVVRHAAREALYRLGISKIFSPALMKTLVTHESPEERARAAEQLGKLGSIYEQDDFDDKSNMGKVSNSKEDGGGGDNKHLRKKVGSDEVAIGEGRELAMVLSQALRDQDWPVRAAAVRAMRMLGSEACEPHHHMIIGLLKDDSSEVREEACLCIGSGGSSKLRFANMIIPLLQDVDDDVRAAATTAIGWLIYEEEGSLQHTIKDCVQELKTDALKELNEAANASSSRSNSRPNSRSGSVTSIRNSIRKSQRKSMEQSSSSSSFDMFAPTSPTTPTSPSFQRKQSRNGSVGGDPDDVFRPKLHVPTSILTPLALLLKKVLAALSEKLLDDSSSVRNASMEALAASPRASYYIISKISDMAIDYKISAASRLSGLELINRLPPALLLPLVPDLLPKLRQAAGDHDKMIREAATEAIQRLSPLRKQALRAAKAAALFYAQQAEEEEEEHVGGGRATMRGSVVKGVTTGTKSGSSGALLSGGASNSGVLVLSKSSANKPLELGHGVGGGGLDELRGALRDFRAASMMFDPKRPWRKLATHPVNLVRSLHEEQRRGLISIEEMNAMIDKIKSNLEVANNAARVANLAVRETKGVLPPEQTGEPITRLCATVLEAGLEQRDMAETTAAEALDFRSVRGASDFVRWDKEDLNNRDRFGGGEWDDAEDEYALREAEEDDDTDEDSWSDDDDFGHLFNDGDGRGEEEQEKLESEYDQKGESNVQQLMSSST